MNPAAESHFDLRGQHVQGRPADGVLADKELGRLLTDLREPSAVLETFNRDDRAYLSSVSTIVAQDGTIGGRVAVLRDVTHLKELDSLKTVFLRMVSHDLRSPLTWMRGYVSMLTLTGDLNDRQQDAVGKIAEGIDLIAEFTARLHELSRLQFGAQAELELELVDAEELLQDVYRSRFDFASSKSIDLRLRATRDRIQPVRVDEMLVRQALANLVDNAIKYTPDGGWVESWIEPSDEGCVTIFVQDSGVGIREEDQKRIFEPFYRVPQRESEPRRPTGSGIGLALVKAVARAHGGGVGFSSEFGKGSTFWFSVPAEPPIADSDD
jgi:signal transduction histidine kinase